MKSNYNFSRIESINSPDHDENPSILPNQQDHIREQRDNYVRFLPISQHTTNTASHSNY